ncbi:MAG TPA: NapC/NirT family cytochrome c [Bryobacteraceae bacterium]|nr:NapC/NirT family cytochrome c [Bryobacteraceae bacterium]
MIRFWGWRGPISPLIYLSSNLLSLAGVAIVTTAAVFWMFLLPTTLSGEITHPYIGILVFLAVPAAFFFGLALIPLGIWLRQRREHRKGLYPTSFPPSNWQNRELRRLVYFVGATTFANLVIASQVTYGAVNYMDSVTFCGQTCHTVMQPEFTAHQNSPHARVACVACHIGPGASWFVRSKISGTGQVFAVLLNNYPRPIPTPVSNLRPARETCEVCHWPAKFGSDRLEVIPSFADDEANTLTKTVLLMKIGGGASGTGIHGVHVGAGVRIRYAYSDQARQTIPWVEYSGRDGRTTVYQAAGTKGPGALPIREMDCIDCHNRPTHIFQLPERAVDSAMAAGDISPSLPFVKKESVEILRGNYASREEAAARIPAALAGYYRQHYPALEQQRGPEIARASRALVGIYDRNVFPAMRVSWGTYPNNIGHNDFPGCFRCHDDAHASADGRKITQDCGACHNLLAMSEPSPKILSDLGLADAAK